MPTEEGNGIRQHIPLIIVIMSGMFLAVLNQTLLSVAIPHFINEFQVTATTAQWLMTGYMLINGVLVPMSAYLIERFGTRNLFIGSMLFFTIGSFICGIAMTFPILLTGRLIQAIGAGILMPLCMTIILYIFPPEKRGKGMGIVGLGIMFAPAIGPTLSGWVMEHYSWRLLFNGIVPLSIIILIIATILMKEVKEKSNPQFSFLGSLLSTLGFGLFIYGLSQAGTDGWTDPIVLSCIYAGLIAILIFIYQQLRAKNPILNFRIFKYDMFSLSTLISMIVTIAMFSGMFLLPIYLQNLRGFSPLESGLLMLPGAIVMGIMSPVSGYLFDKIGPRWLAVVGMAITTVTTWEFTHLTLDTSYNYILTINIIRSLGMSLLMMPIMTAGLNQLPREENSHGTAMSNTMRQVGGSIGISLFTTIFTIRTDFHLAHLKEQTNLFDPLFQQMFQTLSNGLAAVTGTPPGTSQQLATALLGGRVGQSSAVSGINDAFYWATAFALVGFILSFFLRDVRRDKKPELAVKEPNQPSPDSAEVVEEPASSEPVPKEQAQPIPSA
ncbi:drug resistance transporter, EmrB/QacA subfamily [Seinonella peptonophila]|uniref:Drug resistance transporter, EmrB/QacA subfamily n=1 Tax=Seinonella peptonophila TaxID=112248 RepID=A0A1M4Z6G6_9BACL|nr:DHA2 family efflux MFS transporter permease subunit [Seinonella peptonophila]SHF13614.1 drug resistance transporter, EmrB/QacA subfamily [Seinonella peptonophila]